ncbi:hypothetical protein C8C83_5315 [Flavobacterium sp. 90]|nr:hypothetical protein C8C82_5663 [Flavobacterium sp. 81]TCK57271.1 hypothetical protein C8C83_5315 [Flavobacterium sp. 90]
MELTITFFIEFALGIHIILALFFILWNKIEFIPKLDFTSIVSYFQKFFHYNIFSFPKPSRCSS